MSARAGRLGAFVVGGALLLAPAALVAAPAASADPVVQLTSQQLTDTGFPKQPNTSAWDPGTASLPTNAAAPWQDVVITGKAPDYADPGQLLTMYRYLPADTEGDGRLKALNITAVVQADRSYRMHFQLGIPGVFGYAVGYETTGSSPEMIAFQFQFSTTGTAATKAPGSSKAVSLTRRQLAQSGFTTVPNVVGWGGTATISRSKAPAGTPVTVSGRAPAALKAGAVLTLERFVPTDRRGSGHFESVDSVQTTVKPDGTFSLTFEVNQPGRFGYTLGAGLNEEWIGIEFQLKTT
jgi:hypothetical protein